jgi:hypothetical protein
MAFPGAAGTAGTDACSRGSGNHLSGHTLRARVGPESPILALNPGLGHVARHQTSDLRRMRGDRHVPDATPSRGRAAAARTPGGTSRWARQRVSREDSGRRRPIFRDGCLTRSIPSFCSSPWIRGAPRRRFASAIVRIKVRMSADTVGRPIRRRLFHVHQSRKPVGARRWPSLASRGPAPFAIRPRPAPAGPQSHRSVLASRAHLAVPQLDDRHDWVRGLATVVSARRLPKRHPHAPGCRYRSATPPAAAQIGHRSRV